MSLRSLAFASALAVAALGLSGCVSEDGPYRSYQGGYYDAGPVFLGGGYYSEHRIYRPRYRSYDHRRHSADRHVVSHRDRGAHRLQRGHSVGNHAVPHRERSQRVERRHSRKIYPDK